MEHLLYLSKTGSLHLISHEQLQKANKSIEISQIVFHPFHTRKDTKLLVDNRIQEEDFKKWLEIFRVLFNSESEDVNCLPATTKGFIQ